LSASLPIDIAEAVVTELNAGAFSQALNAMRHYRPQFELAELKTLRASVVPKGIVTTSLGRTSNQHDVSVDVAVQKKVDPTDTPALDALMVLVGEVADFLRLRRLSALPTAIWSKTENVPIYSSEHLESKQVFTSLLTFTFRVVR
jgi:hypothetical protein